MLMPAFHKFPDEARIIGRLLVGYAELELDLMNCVWHVHGDFDITLKTMFRTRGERHRLRVADALGRHGYHKLGLGTEFEMAVSSVGYSLKIRNQYAHCNWHDDNSGKLAFVNLEEIADKHDHLTDLRSLTTFHIDEPTLLHQEAYFVYAKDLLRWVNYEGRKREGKVPTQPFAKPPAMKQPALRIQ